MTKSGTLGSVPIVAWNSFSFLQILCLILWWNGVYQIWCYILNIAWLDRQTVLGILPFSFNSIPIVQKSRAWFDIPISWNLIQTTLYQTHTGLNNFTWTYNTGCRCNKIISASSYGYHVLGTEWQNFRDRFIFCSGKCYQEKHKTYFQKWPFSLRDGSQKKEVFSENTMQCYMAYLAILSILFYYYFSCFWEENNFLYIVGVGHRGWWVGSTV